MKNFISFFKRLKKIIYFPVINTLFPNYCWNCSDVLTEEKIGYCIPCFIEIPYIYEQKHCIKCSSLFFVNSQGFCQNCQDQYHENLYFDQNLSCFSYADKIQELIKVGKYGKRRSVWKLLAKEMVTFLQKINLNNDAVIIPVPISKKRYADRGFNQSAITAKMISQKFNLPYFPRVLKKIKNNHSQVELNQNDRKTNPLDCYRVKAKKNIIQDKTILLVDDVFTTGSTVNECSRVLKESGAFKVIVLTVAKSDFD